MALYAIGDIHGCYHEFKKLLKKIDFDPTQDKVYLVGDLINRGPQSTEVLDLILSYPNAILPVLGNHDLAFFVYEKGFTSLKKRDTYDQIVDHPKCSLYLDYLRTLPLIHYIPELNTAICHAGIDPNWTIKQALSLNNEVVELFYDAKEFDDFLPKMFGNTPNHWSDELIGDDRIRAIINSFTRMRFLTQEGDLDFDSKSTLENCPPDLIPWFNYPHRKNKDARIIFGHWGALGFHDENNTICIDTGCVWGGKLTAIQLDTPSPIYFHKKNKKS